MSASPATDDAADMGTSDEFKRFVKLAARALYRDLPAGSAGKTVDVLDALTRHQWVHERSLSKELKVDRKQLHHILEFLRVEKLIRREITTKTKRKKRTLSVASYGQEPTLHSNSYCCLEYAKVYEVVKAQIHSITENLKIGLRSSNPVQIYICGNCGMRYSALDAQFLVSAGDEHFHCEKCNENLLLVDSENRCKDSLEKMIKWKEDLKPLILSVEKLLGVSVPEVLTLQEWTCRKDPSVNAGTAGPKSFDGAANLRSSTVGAASDNCDRALKGVPMLNTLQPLKKLKELPSWMIREGGVNITKEQRKIINDSLLDVEATDSGKQRQEEDPSIQETRRVGMKWKHHDDTGN